jgi:ADP-heptose:LPS heptosyltransferase/GT2 family glycosyltransferase
MAPDLHVLRIHGHAGDVMMATPVLRAFRRAHPADRVYVLAAEEHHGLLHGNTDVDMLFKLESPNRTIGNRIDLADFGAKPWAGTWTHVMDAMAERCGVELDDRSYRLDIPAAAARRADGEAGRLGRFAAVHVKSAMDSKDWPLGNYAALCDALAGMGLSVAQVGGGGDPGVPSARVSDFRGRMSPAETAALISRAELFVGPDSLCMHLARAAREVPCVVLWGSTSPLTSGLFGGSVVNLEPPQRACGHDGRPCHGPCDWTSKCVDKVSVGEAVAAARRMVSPDAGAPDLSIILVNWNSWVQYTHPMVHRLGETVKSPGWEIVLVDNGSREDGPHLAGWTHPRVSAKVLLPENMGLPAAWNIAARRARGRILGFMNTDVRIEEDGWDSRVLGFFAGRPSAAVLGLSLNEPPSLFGERWSRRDLPIRPGEATRCQHVNGSAFFVTRRAFDRIGGFDERYTPGYCEETDYCVRANLAREEVWHIAAAVRHERCGVTRRVNKMDIYPVVAKNNAYFAAKWSGAALPPIAPAGTAVAAAEARR